MGRGADPATRLALGSLIPEHYRVASPEKSLFLHIEALIDDGEVTIGIIRPVGCVAVATDEHHAIAIPLRRPGESLMDLLQRPGAAIEKAAE